jgi:hypothetical protein
VIVDSAKISLFDGTHLPAMEVYPGKSVLSFGHKHLIRAKVLERKVESREDVVGLILSNGQKLTGSRDQKVAVYRDVKLKFTEMADVEIGNRLRGENAGVTTIVTVIGLTFDFRKEVRLVGFEFDHGRNFVAEGVLCR